MGKHNHHNNEIAELNEAEVVEETVEEIVEEAIETVEATIVIFGDVTNCEKLNVRQTPDAKGTVIGVINNGTKVTIDTDESTEEFYRITTATGIEGYCMKKFITIEK